MRKALLDTDTLSELFKGKNPTVVARANEYRAAHGGFTTSVISVLEVVKGLQRVQRDPMLQRFIANLSSFEVVSLGTDASILSGRIYGDLERTGQTIGRIDPMIAGIAIFHGLVLVTGNVGHYARIIDLGYPLQIESWHPVTEVP